MTAVSSPTWGGCAEPDSRRRFAAANIATEDWDLLFRAALELLGRVAIEKAAPDSTGARLQEPGTALRECTDALDQLRRSVPPHSIEQMLGSASSARLTPTDAPAVALHARDEARGTVAQHQIAEVVSAKAAKIPWAPKDAMITEPTLIPE